jgi:hypothetical protein
MATLVWLILAFLYIAAVLVLGVSTLRKGQTVLFSVGIVFAILWIVGALRAPTPQARGT